MLEWKFGANDELDERDTNYGGDKTKTSIKYF